MGDKQLIVVVEGTAAMGPYWKTILSDHLDKIIRSFCGYDSTMQKASAPNVAFSLVMFNTHGPYSSFLVRRSGWTRDLEIFSQWLSAISFGGGGFSDVAIAEGLAEVLMMFSPKDGTQQNMDGQRHCILVAASNPYPLPTPVYRPKIKNLEQTENMETQAENRLSDAEAIAKFFPQLFVSLSVICPKQLPKLRAIYNAGKHNPRAADPPVDNTKNSNFLVLIAENFIEARAALSRSGMTNMVSNLGPTKVDASSIPPMSAPPTSLPSANGSVMNRQPISVGNIPQATVKVEPTTVTSIAGPPFSHVSSVARAASQAIPSLQTSSPLSASQETTSNIDNMQDTKPVVSGATQSFRPVGGAAANVRILNDVAQARQALAGGTSIGLQTMGGPPMLSNMISSGITSSIPSTQPVISSGQSGVTSVAGSMPLAGTGPVVQNSGPAPLTSTTSNLTGNSNISMSQPPNNTQVGIGISQTGSAMSQGNIPASQMVQSGIGMGQNMTSGIAASGMPSGTGTMIPTPGMSQSGQAGMQPLVNNNTTANMSLSQQQTAGAMHSAQSRYVKVWEGNLSGQRQGQPVFITRLEGYRSASASETLAANWPPNMQIVRLISQDHMNNKQYVGKADFLVFRAMNQHGFLGQLQEKKLCAVIQLPSQTLLLSVSDKACRLIGMLFPGDMVVFKPQISNQPQQQQLQHHQQQHMQAQQLQQQQQQLSQIQQQPLAQLQQQQQQPLMQLQQQQQQIPQMQQQQQMAQLQPQQQQQMVGSGMGQTFIQGPGRSQMMSQGQVPPQVPTSMPGGGGFMN